MSNVFDFNLLEKKCNVDMYIYYTMEKVPCKILNTVVLKTWNCSVGEFAFAYW